MSRGPTRVGDGPGTPPPALGGAGTVSALWRYPVKSMQGEAVDATTVGARGLCGDRAYAVIDVATGQVASAKHPRKWAALLRCQASYAHTPRPGAALPPVVVTLPDGTRVRSDDRANGNGRTADAALSRLVGRAVRLCRVAPAGARREADRTPLDGDGLPPGQGRIVREEALALAAPPDSFFDVAAVHVLTTATLAALAARAPSSRFDARRFRPNVVIAPATSEVGFVENAWVGRTLRLGGGARLAVLDPCPRCVVTTLAQSDLPGDPDVLRTAARANAAPSHTLFPGTVFQAVAGVYATVEVAGPLARGMPVELGARRLRASA